MNTGIFAEAARACREARPDLIFFAQRGLPNALFAVLLLDVIRIVDAVVSDPGAFAGMPWPNLVVLGLMALLALAGSVCALYRPRQAVWLLLGLVPVQLALYGAGGAMQEAFMQHQALRQCFLLSLPWGIILVTLAYGLRRVTPAPAR